MAPCSVPRGADGHAVDGQTSVRYHSSWKERNKKYGYTRSDRSTNTNGSAVSPYSTLLSFPLPIPLFALLRRTLSLCGPSTGFTLLRRLLSFRVPRIPFALLRRTFPFCGPRILFTLFGRTLSFRVPFPLFRQTLPFCRPRIALILFSRLLSLRVPRLPYALLRRALPFRTSSIPFSRRKLRHPLRPLLRTLPRLPRKVPLRPEPSVPLQMGLWGVDEQPRDFPLRQYLAGMPLRREVRDRRWDVGCLWERGKCSTSCCTEIWF